MGMRKGRSGESPHGKNCGMKSRLAGAVRCLVHACLTAAANVGALCMKGWRWMLGAFARTRTSAKRTLTNIEGVLVTLALIATLGIASPLAAGAIEPVEDPTPVSGVLDADGAQIADAADSDDVIDESDVADSDETAKDDASAEQDATEGDAADEATEDADADADASEKDASTDGEQPEKAVDANSSDKPVNDKRLVRDAGKTDPVAAAKDQYAFNPTGENSGDSSSSGSQPGEVSGDCAGSGTVVYNPLGQVLTDTNLFMSGNVYIYGNDTIGTVVAGGTYDGILKGRDYHYIGKIGKDVHPTSFGNMPGVNHLAKGLYIGGTTNQDDPNTDIDESNIENYLLNEDDGKGHKKLMCGN